MATGGLYGSSGTGALIAQPGAETPGLYGKSPNGSVVATTGSETAGLYGNSVNFGGTFFEWFIFKEAATQPATPTGGSWDFTTNIGTAPTGWTGSPPTAPVYQIWVSIAIVNSKTPTTLTWSVPGLMGVVASTTVGTTTTGAAGSSASVNNSGTSVNAVLNFTIPQGATGSTGATGATGPTGPAGPGVATGGTAGQVLAKVSSTNYDTTWVSAGGSVTSVGLTAPSFLSVSGSPVTTSGTLALSYSGTALPVANGGTGVTASSGVNSVVLRDANGNITTNCLFEGFTSQAASGTTIVLTAASVQNFQITGSGGQIIRLPNATTLPNGALFTFNNNQSSGAITVQNNSSTTVATINSGGYVTVSLLDNTTAAGSWDRHDSTPSNVSWSTNTLDYAGSITSATWNGNSVAYNRGGTGQSSAFVAGGVVYGSTTSALAVTPIGTSGQVLTSSGSGTPIWTTPTAGTVTSVSGTSPVVSSGGATPTISLATSYGDTQNPYASKTANYVLAAPNGINGAPTFRAIVASDIPTLNQNTTGTAANITATSNSTLTTLSSLSLPYSQLSGTVPTWNQNTTGQAGQVANALTAGTNITFSSGTTYDGSAAITINATGGSMVYPAVGIPNSTGTAWGTSYSTTGSGTVVALATSPSFTTPILGTPTSGNFSTGTFTWPTFNQNTTGSAATLTTARAIYGNNFDGSAALTQIIASTYGGTGNGFTKFSGATTAEKTYTLPDATTTILTTNAAVTIGQGGTGQTTASAAFDALAPSQTSNSGKYLTTNGTTTSWATVSGSGATITNDTTTSTNVYPLFAAATSGSLTTAYTSNAKYLYKPSTGELTAPEHISSNGIMVNSTTVSASYTIATGNNGFSVGPLTVNSGVTVTISSGQRHVII